MNIDRKSTAADGNPATARVKATRVGTGRQATVVVPCFNSEAATARVVDDCRAALSQANILVYNNNSYDGTTKLSSSFERRAPGDDCDRRED
jgi:hypothetical protein